MTKAVEAGGNFTIKLASIRWKTVLQALVIVAAGLWIYWPALDGDWFFDDNTLIATNSNLRSLQGLWQIWSAPTNYYLPLTSTLLWIEWQLWGNEPLGYHLCNLALHILSGFLIWRLFNRLGLRWGWFGGFLFVIHPLAVESVAWVSEIKNTLSLPLFLLSFDAWLDAEEKKSSYLRSVFFYCAAMLAKTSTIMLPLVLLLYCWWKRGRVTRQELIQTIPYFFIAVVLGLATVLLQSQEQGAEFGGFATRLIGAESAIFFYLGKFIFPATLMPIYPRWNLDTPSFLQVMALPTLVVLLFGFWTQRKGWGRIWIWLLFAQPAAGAQFSKNVERQRSPFGSRSSLLHSANWANRTRRAWIGTTLWTTFLVTVSPRHWDDGGCLGNGIAAVGKQ